MKSKIVALTAIVALFGATSVTTAQDAANGKPFGGKPCSIPGLIQAENLDGGPEGVSVHETDELTSNGVMNLDSYRFSEVTSPKTKAKPAAK